MVESSPARWRLWAYAGLYFFWGTTFLGIRIAVQHGLPPFFLSGLRHGSAGLILLVLARQQGAAWPSRAQALGAALMGVLFLAAANGTCAWAMQYVESGYATLVIAGVPLMAFGYSAIFQGQKVRHLELALLLLGLLGVAILFSPGAASQHSSNAWGLAALVVATLIWSVTMAEKKRFAQPTHPLMLTAFQMLGGGSVLGLVSLGVEHPWTLDFSAVPLQAWAAWAYLVVFGSCVGYASFSYLLGLDPPQRVGTYAYVNPIVAVLAGHWILGEAISPVILVSGALIVASVAGLLSMKRG